MNESEVKPIVLTPRSVCGILNNAIKVKEEMQLVILRGIYQQGPPKDYAGFFYDSIKEEGDDFVLGIKVSALNRSKLKPGTVIEAYGFIDRKVDNKGVIKILFNLTEVIGQAKAMFSEADIKALELVQAKAQRGYRDVESFLTKGVIDNKKPVIKIFVGHTAIVDQDIKVGFGESISYFNPEFLKINLSDPETIIKVITQTKCDVLMIARGGGSGLDVFNHIGVAKAALECKPFLLSAIGHAADQVLLDRLSDKFWITPTDAGNFFRSVYNRSIEQLSNSNAKFIEEANKNAQKEVAQKLLLQEKLLAEKDKQLKERVPTSKVILYLVAAVIVTYFVAYFIMNK